jgi:hypothetical protein
MYIGSNVCSVDNTVVFNHYIITNVYGEKSNPFFEMKISNFRK